MYGMNPRGIFELRDLGQAKFQSAGVEDFIVEMHKLHEQIKGQLQNNNEIYKDRIDQ
jgi:hypothetical protein